METNLSHADMSEVNLRGRTSPGQSSSRRMSKMYWQDTPRSETLILSKVKDLATVRHEGLPPSVIDTVYNSREQISQVFLKGLRHS